MRKTYYDYIKAGEIFECGIKDKINKSWHDDYEYFSCSSHLIKLLLKPVMKGNLIRIYEKDFENLENAELFISPTNQYSFIYQIPTKENCENRKLYEDVNGKYFIFSIKELTGFYTQGTGLHKALEKIFYENNKNTT